MNTPKVTDITIIIPSLNPDDKFIKTLDTILHNGFKKVVVVNDGSDARHLEPFEYALRKGCTVLVHETNKGKGAALKTAFDHCWTDKECTGVITVDGDGQHDIEGIFQCGLKMITTNKVVLGCRDFSSPNVPFKSKYGNNITKFAFRALCGIKLSDTQTGLRAIPAAYLPFMCGVSGDRFEYETNALLEMADAGISWVEQKINTIYIDDNASTHFRPFQDGWKIYKIIFKHSFGRLFKFLLSSGLSAMIDVGLFSAILHVVGNSTSSISYGVITATIIARIISSIFNFLVNKNLVFKDSNKQSLVRYYFLWLVQLSASTFFVNFAAVALKPTCFWTVVIKAVIDTLLFFVSYSVQKDWVFKSEKRNNNNAKVQTFVGEVSPEDYESVMEFLKAGTHHGQGCGMKSLLSASMAEADIESLKEREENKELDNSKEA